MTARVDLASYKKFQVTISNSFRDMRKMVTQCHARARNSGNYKIFRIWKVYTLNLCFRGRRIVWWCLFFGGIIQLCDTDHLFQVYQYFSGIHVMSAYQEWTKYFCPSYFSYSLTPIIIYQHNKLSCLLR